MIIRSTLLAAIASLALGSLHAQDAAVTAIELTPSKNPATPLAYDKTEFTIKAGSKVKVTVSNIGAAVPQPHNFVLVKPGTDGKVVAASMGMMSDPTGMTKSYIPQSTDIIAHTSFAQPGQTQSVEFTAPMDAGDYPFFCTFPGHAMLMKGVLKVTVQ
jgi:azurin